jgi:hypothetical protein
MAHRFVRDLTFLWLGWIFILLGLQMKMQATMLSTLAHDQAGLVVRGRHAGGLVSYYFAKFKQAALQGRRVVNQTRNRLN